MWKISNGLAKNVVFYFFNELAKIISYVIVKGGNKAEDEPVVLL